MADHKHLIEQYLKACSTGDVEGAVACFTEDAVFDDLALGVVLTGHTEIREFIASVFAAVPDFSCTAQRIFVDGDQVCTQYTFGGTQTGDFPGLPATGKPAEIRGVSVDVVTGGRISHHTDYWNLVSYLQQVGLMPGPEA